MSQVICSQEDFRNGVVTRIRTLTLPQAKEEVEAKSAAGGAALRDIDNKVIVFYEGFEQLLPGTSKVTAESLNGLIFNFVFEVLVRCYCRSAREVLPMNGLNRLKGTHFEVMFPSKIRTPDAFNGMSHRLIELVSEPILLVYPSGDTSFASIDLYVLKGVFRSEALVPVESAFRALEFFPVTPIIKQGKKELLEESNLVKNKAAPYIFKHLLNIWTPRQQDVLELLAAGKRSKEIAAILTEITGKDVTESTVETHRRDIKTRIKPYFANYNDVDMAMILKGLGCL